MSEDKTKKSVNNNEKLSLTKKIPDTNKYFVDKYTNVDDLLAIIAELLIEGNATQQEVLSKIVDAIKIKELIDAAANEIENKIEYENIDDKIIKPGDIGISLAICNSGNIGSFIINNIIVNGIAKADVTAYERIIVTPGGTSDEPYVVPLSVLIKGDKGVIAQDANNRLISAMYGDQGVIAQDEANNLIAVMKANYAGSLITVASDANGLMQTDVNKSEKISILETSKASHFTGAIAQNEQETENITGLGYNKIYIRGVNIQTTENLHLRLIFWGKDTFDNTDLDDDTYIDHVDIDIPTNGFRIWDAAFHQYYLNISGLGIMYEDEDKSQELHISLQNLSPTAKSAGSNVQIDILYSPRL